MCIVNHILALPYTCKAWMGWRNKVSQAHEQRVYLFIGEFAIYQAFAQMKQNLNFDVFYLIKYSD
jgi:hypothetical protein